MEWWCGVGFIACFVGGAFFGACIAELNKMRLSEDDPDEDEDFVDRTGDHD